MIKLILKNLYSFVLESENEKQEKLIGKCVNGHFYKLNYGFCKYCNSKTKTKEVFIQPVVESKVKSNVLIKLLTGKVYNFVEFGI
jgi:hypothetical protein